MHETRANSLSASAHASYFCTLLPPRNSDRETDSQNTKQSSNLVCCWYRRDCFHVWCRRSNISRSFVHPRCPSVLSGKDVPNPKKPPVLCIVPGDTVHSAISDEGCWGCRRSDHVSRWEASNWGRSECPPAGTRGRVRFCKGFCQATHSKLSHPLSLEMRTV